MFQTRSPEELYRQEMLMRNPGLLQNQQGAVSQQDYQQLRSAATTAYNCAVEFNKQIEQHKLITQQAIAAFNAMAYLVSEISEVTEIALQALNYAGTNAIAANDLAYHLADVAVNGSHQALAANAYLQELLEAYNLIQAMQVMLSNPFYLANHAFEVFGETVTPEDEGFVNLVSGNYMNFINSFEEKFKSVTGQYTPQFSDYLQTQINQNQYPGFTPPVQNQDTQQLVNSVKAFATALQTPGFGKQLQRQHAMVRQQAGVL